MLRRGGDRDDIGIVDGSVDESVARLQRAQLPGLGGEELRSLDDHRRDGERDAGASSASASASPSFAVGLP